MGAELGQCNTLATNENQGHQCVIMNFKSSERRAGGRERVICHSLATFAGKTNNFASSHYFDLTHSNAAVSSELQC